MAKKSLIEKWKRPAKFSTRKYNRCRLCGRSGGYLRKFELCRICFREIASKGEVPGGDKGELVKKGLINMSITDPVADFLTLIRNACRAKKEKVDVPNSKMNREVLIILKREGYIADFKMFDSPKVNLVRVYLKYLSGYSAIKNLKRISKPGLRVYTSNRRVPSVLRGLGIAVISTPKGVITNKEARELKVGGEVLCYIW